MQRKYLSIAVSIALASLVSACGGGGGGGGSDSSPNNGGNSGGNNGGNGGSTTITAPAGSTLTTPTYATSTAEAQMLSSINSHRQQCGFPAFQQNTVLEKAAAAHAKYMIDNGAVIGHSEVAGNVGFTGATVQDRVVAQGWPSALGVGEVAAGAVWMMEVLPQTRYGQSMVDAWAGGPYHQLALADTSTLVGIGSAQKVLQGFPQVLGALVHANSASPAPSMTTAGNVLTFPCQGSTGLPYKTLGETPTPPGTSGAWGTPVSVTGNSTDTVVLTSGSMTAAGSAMVISLYVLTSSNDPAKLVQKHQAVAYPTVPLEPNTTYSVTLSGTVNGVPFTRSFTFSTSNTVV